MSHYVKVCEFEGETPVELPLEDDGSLLLPTLTAQFPKCTGIKYQPEGHSCARGVRLVDDRLYAPAEEGWLPTFICVFPKDNKRRGGEDSVDDCSLKATKRFDGRKCTDLVVLNLPWRCEEEELKQYFVKYGELATVQIKREPVTKKSRGYGFIRFRDYDAQVMCLSEVHRIQDRRCDVRIPMSKVEGDRQEVSRKIHVGGVTHSMDATVLRRFFSKYGCVIDVFIPRPFRSFAFVTFDDIDAPSALMGQELEIDGQTVTIGSAVPKLPPHLRTSSTNGDNGSSDQSSTSRTQALDVAFQQSLLMGQPNTPWNAWSPSPYGVLGNSPDPVPPPAQQPQRGGGGPPMGPNHPVGGGGGLMGLNHVTAAAAANLAAQYTRAHQKQTASVNNSNSNNNPMNRGGGGPGLMGPATSPAAGMINNNNAVTNNMRSPAAGGMQSHLHQLPFNDSHRQVGGPQQHPNSSHPPMNPNSSSSAAAIATFNILQDPNVVAAIVSAATGGGGPQGSPHGGGPMPHHHNPAIGGVTGHHHPQQHPDGINPMMFGGGGSQTQRSVYLPTHPQHHHMNR